MPERVSADDSMTSSKFYYERCREISHRYPDPIGVPSTHDVLVTIKKPTVNSPLKIRDAFPNAYDENTFEELKAINDTNFKDKKDHKFQKEIKNSDFEVNSYQELKKNQKIDLPYGGTEFSGFKSIGSPNGLVGGRDPKDLSVFSRTGGVSLTGDFGKENIDFGEIQNGVGGEKLAGKKIEALLKEGDLVFGDDD